MPTTKGKAAIETMIGDMVKDPNFALSFTTDDVEVARSGDLAYETGTWQMTSTDPVTKKPATARGDFVTVWKKQADGTWKCVVDAPVPGPAAAAPKS
jgi:ketosteroid isomerase-like protein